MNIKIVSMQIDSRDQLLLIAWLRHISELLAPPIPDLMHSIAHFRHTSLVVEHLPRHPVSFGRLIQMRQILVRCWKSQFFYFRKVVESELFHKSVSPGCLLFFFLVDIRSFSVLAAGSDNVGAKYFRPDALPILSDLGREVTFCFRGCCSFSCLIFELFNRCGETSTMFTFIPVSLFQ